MKILTTGLTGLVGSRIQELLKNQYQFENLGSATGFDITNKEQVIKTILASDFDVFLHLAGKTYVDGCEEDKTIDEKFLNNEVQESEIVEKKTAWALNTLGTRNITDAVKEKGKKLIYISTDFVFDGEKEGGYKEDDPPSPINWYGKTKYEGEKEVERLDDHLILRLSYPYRASFTKKDFVRVYLSLLEDGRPLRMVEDHVMTPTFIDDVARGMDLLIKKNEKGIFHLTGSSFVTPFDAAEMIADEFDLNKSLISKTSRLEYFRNKAPRPFFLGMKNDKITKLGISMKTFEEGLVEIKEQMEDLT